MPYRRYDRLAALAEVGGLVALACRGCRRRAYLLAREVYQAKGVDRPLAALRFTCSSCGSRAVEARAFKPAVDSVDRRRG